LPSLSCHSGSSTNIKLCVFFLLLLGAQAAYAERLAISADTANIRSGPGTEYEILWKVEKYHPIVVLETRDSWYHFRDFEGDRGWVHKSLVDNIDTVITKNEINNIRSGPGTDYKILFSVEKGIPFKVIKREGNWIQIRHADGDQGWIYAGLVW
jgi:SH3-like domain-containing protein